MAEVSLRLPLSKKSLRATWKIRVHGLTYLLSHPYLLKRVIMRELLYRRRYHSKWSWMKWQIYDAYTSLPQHGSPESYSRPLNISRIKVISDMVNSLGYNLEILDVGCGDGSIGKPLRKKGYHVVSVELPKVAVLAKKKYGVPSIIVGDAETLPFRSEAFDVVIAAELWEHLWNPRVFIQDAYRILKADGHLIISGLEGPWGLRYDTHKQFITVEILEDTLRKRFAIREVKHIGPLGAPTRTIITLFRKVSNSDF